MRQILTKENFIISPAEADSPTYNGTAECFNKELRENAKAMMFDSGFTYNFGIMLLLMQFLYSLTPKKTLEFSTLYEKLFKWLPNLKFM